MFRVRNLLFFLLPLFLLIPAFLLIVCLSPGIVTPPLPASQPSSGLGGAFGATSYTLPVAATVTPTATPVAELPKIYGGSGKDGACLGTLGAGNDMIKMDFGWATSVLNKQWRNYTAYRLCNDRYIWETVTALPLKTVLQTLQWPPDLLNPQYTNQIVTLEPLSTFDPVTQQAQQQAQQGNQQTSTETNKNCLWHVQFSFVDTSIDICQPIRLLINAASQSIRGTYQSTASHISFMWTTPEQPFTDNKTSGLLTVWSESWAIVLACIVAVVAYGSLRFMIGSAVSWLAYANIAELVPRLLFGLLAAYFSKEFFLMLIQANNALAGIFNHASLDTVINGSASGMVNESLQILYGLMGFCLMIEEVARIAILYILFAFAPILFFFASLRETQRWAKTAAVAVVVFAFIQAAQAAVLDVGGRVLETVLKNTSGNLNFLNLLVSLAILYLVLLLFFSLARLALGGGFSPYYDGMFGISRSLLPLAASTVGTAANRYANFRRTLFPLPDPDGRSPGSPVNSSGRRPGGPGGFGNNGQTIVTIGEKPYVNSASNGNQPGASASGSSSPSGSSRNIPAGSAPAGSTKKPGVPRGSSPAGSRTPTLQSSSSAVASSGGARVSGPGAVRGTGASSPIQHTGTWQKTPPQTQRRRMTEQELIDWLNEEDSH